MLEQVDWPGNLDMLWEDPDDESWYGELASFSRLILHDRRGIGLSSRNVALPNLETRVADTLAVLDAVGSERPVLSGTFESGAPNVLLAATRPDRVRAMVWIEPIPRFGWAPDYPWGHTDAQRQAELEDIEGWGTMAYGQAFAAEWTGQRRDPAATARSMAKASRNACTPDVARSLAEIWYETDVRDVLPSVKVPTLIVAGSDRPMDRGAVGIRRVPDPGRGDGAVSRKRPLGREHPRDRGHDPSLHRGRAAPRRSSTPSCRPCCSPTSWDPPNSSPRAATTPGSSWSNATTRSSAPRWLGGEGSRTTPPATASTRRSTDRLGRSAAASRSTERVRALGIEVRAGVHTGECELVDGKHAGITVSIGARIATLAGPSELLVSQTVKDLVAGAGFTFEDAGEHELKGVPDRWRLYRVIG